MTHTLPAGPIPDEMLTAPILADILDAAAQLIEQDGTERGDWWPDAQGTPWQTGMPCCAAGAIGVAAGYRTASEIGYCVTGVEGTATVRPDPHPAFAALMQHLKVCEPEDVFDWSDTHTSREVVAELRDCAALLRTRVAA